MTENLFNSEAFEQMPGQMSMEAVEPTFKGTDALGRMDWCIASYDDEPEFSAQLVSDEGAFGYIVLDGQAGRRHQVPYVRPEIEHERVWRVEHGFYVEQMRDRAES